MEKFLRTLTLSSGIAIICISLTHVALGQSWLPDTQSVTASLDSQHRFYTALFLPYGAALVWLSRDVHQRLWSLHIVLAAVFFGGIARAVSYAAAGLPHPFFIGLWVGELVIPPLVYLAGRSLETDLIANDLDA